MVQYVKVSEGVVQAYPYTDYALFKDNPDVSFPQTLSDETRASFGVFPVTPASPVANKIQLGLTCELINGVWTEVATWGDVPLPTSESLLAYLKDKRRTVETGGITLSGMSIATDRESQSMLTGAYTMAQIDTNRTFNWQTETGFVTLGAAQVTALAETVGNHVQNCFNLQKTLIDQITAGTLTTYTEIDNASWQIAY